MGLLEAQAAFERQLELAADMGRRQLGRRIGDRQDAAVAARKHPPTIIELDKLSDLKNTDIKEVANQAKDYARQNPGQAILISAAAGLVLGMLIRGSRR